MLPPQHPSAQAEMLHAIDERKGWEVDLGRSVPFYAFLCVDLVKDMDGNPTDTRELHATMRPRRHSGMGSGVLATMAFPYTNEGLIHMFEWIDEQKHRVLCENANHTWCKLALPDFHLCACCSIKACCLGRNVPSSVADQSGCEPSAAVSIEMKPVV